MQYIYVLDYSTPSRVTIKVADDVDVSEKIDDILNLNTKTQAVYTAFADDWEHFLKLGADNVSGKVHPNMQLVAKKIKEIIETL